MEIFPNWIEVVVTQLYAFVNPITKMHTERGVFQFVQIIFQQS